MHPIHNMGAKLQKNAFNKNFFAKKFASSKKTTYLCTRNRQNESTASVAQLVRAPDC